MILEISGVAMSFGATVVLKNVTFQIHERERVAIVGYNGCGKTTLLNIITGELEQTGGFVVLKNGATLGYLKQTSGLDPNNTVWQEMKSVHQADVLLARMKQLEQALTQDESLLVEYEDVCARYEAIDGYHLDYNIRRVLNGLSFGPDTDEKSVGVLSGGEKTRLALAKLLILQPDLLILDEPTNHLDMAMLEWLEGFLAAYKGAVLMVSHDRYFLDHAANRILEIQNGKSKMYSGNFSAYLSQKNQQQTRERETFERTLAEADKLRDYAARNIERASTSKMAKSRLKMLGRLDLTAPEDSSHVSVRFRIESQSEPYKDVIFAENLSISAGGKPLVSELNLHLMRGERLAIIGANGTGKTTLLKTVVGQHRFDSGRLRLGGGLKIGYLEQNLFGVHAKNPLYYIWDRYPAMSQLEIRNLLAAVGFRGEEVFTSAAGLSGGELARLNFARIALERPNLLVLDEPTNHLDIYTRDILCEAMSDYSGTMIVVTHDRYLMEQLNCRILLLADGKAIQYDNYRQYRASLATGDPEPTAEESAVSTVKPLDDKPLNPKEQRQQRARDRERKLFLENRIAELEEDAAYLSERINSPGTASDHEKLMEYCAMLESSRQELARLSEEWLESFSE